MSYYNEKVDKLNDFSAFEMSIRENISFQASAFEKCNNELNDIEDRLKGINKTFDVFKSVYIYIDKVKSFVHEDIFAKQILFIEKEIEQMHVRIRDITDIVVSHSINNQRLMVESKEFSTKIYNENQMIYNMTKAIGNDCNRVYQKMQDDNKLISKLGIDLSQLADAQIKKIESISVAIDEMERVANSALNNMKNENAHRIVMIVIFAVICTILISFTLSIIIIFR